MNAKEFAKNNHKAKAIAIMFLRECHRSGATSVVEILLYFHECLSIMIKDDSAVKNALNEVGDA